MFVDIKVLCMLSFPIFLGMMTAWLAGGSVWD